MRPARRPCGVACTSTLADEETRQLDGGDAAGRGARERGSGVACGVAIYCVTAGGGYDMLRPWHSCAALTGMARRTGRVLCAARRSRTRRTPPSPPRHRKLPTRSGCFPSTRKRFACRRIRRRRRPSSTTWNCSASPTATRSTRWRESTISSMRPTGSRAPTSRCRTSSRRAASPRSSPARSATRPPARAGPRIPRWPGCPRPI